MSQFEKCRNHRQKVALHTHFRDLYSHEKHSENKQIRMYKYACAALGVDCTFTTTADSVEEIKKAVFAHADEVHIDMLEAMTPEQLADLEKAVEGALVPV